MTYNELYNVFDMAKIEIKGSPNELERVSIFLKNNNIQYSIVDDYGNHSKEDSEKYQNLIKGS